VDGKAGERRRQFARGWLLRRPKRPRRWCSISELLQAVDRVVVAIPSPVLHRVVARPLDVESATRRIEQLLDEREHFSWAEALGPRPTIVDVLSTLLALLELAKRGALRILQPAAFAPMVIARDPARPAA
jgi:chromatin segregation and condensation protein Rec8/ScpA/Scc1 (kleisin family)